MAILSTLVEASLRSTSGLGSLPPYNGLFVSSQSPSDVMSLGSSLGITPNVMTVYADGSCYCTYANPPSTPMTLMLGVGALTSSEATSIGQSLVAAGQSDAIIRVMWEQNQDVSGWFQGWNQLAYSAAQYVSTFQSIVTTMRAVPGQGFRFMWNPNGGTANEAAGRSWNDTWPGKAFVDYVGVDQYDDPEYASNIQTVISFAQAQGLATALPEWGLNGSDDPSYIDGIASLVNNPANDVALEAYFSYAGSIDSDITQFPQSETAFKADFSGAPAVSTIPSTPTTTPSTSTPATTPATAPTTPTSVVPSSPHVMLLMMENQGYSNIIGNSALPYINQLATDYGSATNSYSYAHPSLPNYLAITSGSNQGVTVDEAPSSSGTFNGPTLASQLSAGGFTAKAYVESLPSDPTNSSGLYDVYHDPWEYFSNTLPVENSSSAVSDLNSASPPDFVWYTPNLTDDMHTGQPTDTESNELAGGETFLSSFIPSLQATTWYADGGQIVIEWDEALDSDTAGVNGGSGGQVATIVVSADLKAHPVQSATPVDTVGVLHSIEDAFGLTHLGGSGSDGSIDSLLRPGPVTPPTTTPSTTVPTTTPSTTTPSTTPPGSPSTTVPTTSPTSVPTTPSSTSTTTTVPTTTPSTTPPSSPSATVPTTSPAGPAPTVTAVTVAPDAGSPTQVLTATVSPIPNAGVVSFSVDNQIVATQVPVSPDGTATVALTLPDGPHSVDATYSGTKAFASSAVATELWVGLAATTLTASAPALISSGDLYRLSATLTSGQTPVAGAPVSFSASGSSLCEATTNNLGHASCAVARGTADALSIIATGYTASFAGDSTHQAASGHSPIFGQGNGSAQNGGKNNSNGDGTQGSPTRPWQPDSETSASGSSNPPSWSSSSRRAQDSDGRGGHHTNPRSDSSGVDKTGERVLAETSATRDPGSGSVGWLLILVVVLSTALLVTWRRLSRSRIAYRRAGTGRTQGP